MQCLPANVAALILVSRIPSLGCIHQLAFAESKGESMVIVARLPEAEDIVV